MHNPLLNKQETPQINGMILLLFAIYWYSGVIIVKGHLLERGI